MILRGDFVHGGGLFDKSGGSATRFHASIPLYRTHLGCGSNKDFERRSGRGSAVYYANLLETPAPKTPNAETSIYRQESKEENSDMNDHEHAFNPETDSSPSANPPFNNEETSIYRQESNDDNAAMPDPETGMTNPETATSPSANPPYNNDVCLPKLHPPYNDDDCLPELPQQLPLVQDPKQASESDHEHAASKPTPSPKSAVSNSAPKSSTSNRVRKSACKPKSVKKQKTSAKFDNPFDVFGGPIDCSKFDNYFGNSNYDSSLYPWASRRSVKKG